MSEKVGEHFYCVFCDLKFHSQADLNMHCNGKKHKNHERIKEEQDAAAASVLVRFVRDCNNKEQLLASYFCKFGLLAKVSILGPAAHGVAKVQFAQPKFAEKALAAGKFQKYRGHALKVCKFEYKPYGGDALRVAAKEEKQNQKTTLEDLHNRVTLILGKENSVSRPTLESPGVSLGLRL
ncbi:speckle targeted PIP5K1A-regulated poly(A) polymerase [Elysia marginata]|uniref:Speckle targeted PIP5K1A-regulated poly(A) polymerase n=1 Tax=Elysia marginata TaxID=1093978 RepID=A0AAV4FN97_9GAST|nr:speckle targeted PIP5K1A-regulated poly(A) polymerase [Elysia marginata]